MGTGSSSVMASKAREHDFVELRQPLCNFVSPAVPYVLQSSPMNLVSSGLIHIPGAGQMLWNASQVTLP